MLTSSGPPRRNDPGLVSEMGLALDGLFVGQSGNDGLILQLWSRRCALNISLPLATAVLQDVRERNPGGIISTLSVDRYFRIPEGSPIVAAVLDELGVDVDAEWGLQWRNGTLTPATLRATLSEPTAALNRNPDPPVLSAAPRPPDPARTTWGPDRFFQLQQTINTVAPISEPHPVGRIGAAAGSRPADPQPAPLHVVPTGGDEPLSDPFMQYLFTDVPVGGIIRVEIEDTSLESWFVLEAFGSVAQLTPIDPFRPPRPDKSLLMSMGKCIALILPGCRLTLESHAQHGRLRWRTDGLHGPARATKYA